eukprot:6200316-Pleurochrysis_carterae.AAC.5
MKASEQSIVDCSVATSSRMPRSQFSRGAFRNEFSLCRRDILITLQRDAGILRQNSPVQSL